MTSGLPSPVKSPGLSSVVKLFHPAPTVRWPRNPPLPSPLCSTSRPSDRRASRSVRPSPPKSPTGKMWVYMPQLLAILLCGASVAPARPGYSHRDPSVPSAMTSEIASAVQVPAVTGFHEPVKLAPMTLGGAQPGPPVPAYILSSPVLATTASTSALWSPLKSRGYDGAERTLVL